jgi:hypothetical protein
LDTGASPTPTDNGVATLPASEILSRSHAALTKAASVHLKGDATDDDGQRFTLDLHFADKGGRGTLTQSGQTLEVLRIGTTVYIKADVDFWRTQTGNAAVAELLKGKYLKGSTTDPKTAAFAELTQLDKFAADLFDPKQKVTRGERKALRGVDAIVLQISGKDRTTLYVATRGEPYPLRATSSSPSQPGTIDFLDYGAPLNLVTPPAEHVVDTSKLGGR